VVRADSLTFFIPHHLPHHHILFNNPEAFMRGGGDGGDEGDHWDEVGEEMAGTARDEN
jgi:hypothetical protein